MKKMATALRAERLLVTAAAVWLLAGCGVETATTAATAAQVKATEAERARQQLEAAKKEIDAAQQIMTQRLEDIGREPAADAGNGSSHDGVGAIASP